MKQLKMGLLVGMSLLLFTGCQKQEEVPVEVVKPTVQTEKVDEIEPKEEILKGEDWLYYRESYDGPLRRIALASQKDEQVVNSVSQWLVAEDQLLYTSKEEWELAYQSKEAIVTLNELFISQVDGSGAKKLVGQDSEIAQSIELDAAQYYLMYTPLAIVKDWVYFTSTFGIPETDASHSIIYRIRTNGKDLEELCVTGYENVSEFYIAGEYIYFATSYIGDDFMTLNQVDLRTKEKTTLVNQGTLLGTYKDELYYGEIVSNGEQYKCKVKKIVTGKKAPLIKEIIVVDNVGYEVAVKLQDNKLYIGRLKEENNYSTLIYDEAYDLDTNTKVVSLPYEQSYRGGSARREAISQTENQIYFLSYKDDWHWDGKLCVVDTKTKQEKTLKDTIFEAEVISLYTKGKGQKILEREVLTAQANRILQEQLYEEKSIVYSDTNGLYRMSANGNNATKLYHLEGHSGWQYDKEDKALYFNLGDKLYKGNLEGTSVEVIVEEGAYKWQYLKDEKTGEGWFLCEDNAQSQKLVNKAGTAGPQLPNQYIETMLVYGGRFIYHLSMSPYGDEFNEAEAVIYQIDPKGNRSVLVDFHNYYTPTEEGWDSGMGIMSQVAAVKDEQLYFTVNDYERYVAELFVYDLKTAQAKSIYKAQSGFEPYLYVNVEDDYIYTGYTEMRHSYVYNQLDRQTFEVVDYGEKIGESGNVIYSLKYDGIYAFDKKTKKSERITEVYPMYWYDDYKDNWAYQMGDHIYFNDYSTYPSESEYDNRAEMKDDIYRINLKTRKREQVPEELRHVGYYNYENNKVDQEGYVYFNYVDNNVCKVLRYKEKVEVIAEVDTQYITSMMLVE